MNRGPNDDDLETRLASAFRARSLPGAPSRLREALERVPDVSAAADRTRRERGRNRRTTLWLVGLAASVALGGALILGGGSRPNEPGPGPSEGPSMPLGTIVTYEIGWTAAKPFDDASLARLVGVVRRRLDAIGTVGATARAVDQGHLAVAIPAGLDPDPIRRLLGQIGRVSFVPLGTDPLEAGDPLDPALHPALFGGEGIADARVATDQQGRRVVEFQLTPAATSLFRDYTAAHIGEFFAIVVDDVVVTAPAIRSEIPDGNVQITKAVTVGGYPLEEARQLIVVMLGPLPAPLREIAVERSPVDPSLALPPTAAPSR